AVATLVAVAGPLALALAPGDFAFGTLWQLFGTTNQLTAGLALAVIAVWVTKSSRNPLAVLVPLVFLLVMTSWALVINLVRFVTADDPVQVFLLAPLDAVIFALALWLIVEASLALRSAWTARTARPAGAAGPAGPADGGRAEEGTAEAAGADPADPAEPAGSGER